MLPITYAISSGEAADSDLESSSKRIVDQARMLARFEVSHFQIREKRLSASNLYKLSLEVAGALSGSRTRLLINDRADIAMAIGAYGVHLASNSLPIEYVRRSFGTEFNVFVSTHSIDDVRRAAIAGADAVVFGPIFSTPAKSEFVGLVGLENAVNEQFGIPIIALGGVDSENCRSAINAGASGVAGIRAFADHDSVGRLLEELGRND